MILRLSEENWKKFKNCLTRQLNKPYKFGVEVDIKDPSPAAFDCSELVEWAFAQIGWKVPDGSENQYLASLPIENPTITTGWGFLGFNRPDGKSNHVVLWYDELYCIEARGKPANVVKLTPSSKWRQWKDFEAWRAFDLEKIKKL